MRLREDREGLAHEWISRSRWVFVGLWRDLTRQLNVHTCPSKGSSDFIAHLEQLDRLFGPQPGRHAKPVVLVEDNGPIHASKRSLAALAARAHWLTVEWLVGWRLIVRTML